MKRLVLALFIVAIAIVPARAEERIQRFISDVDVQRNGDLLVTETIEIWTEGRQVKRGILRDFPTVYHRTDGSRVEVGFTVQDVTRDGAAEAFATEKMANGMRVRVITGCLQAKACASRRCANSEASPDDRPDAQAPPPAAE